VLFLFTEIHANGGIQRFNQTLLDACGGLGIGGEVLSLQDGPAIAGQAKHPPFVIAGFSGKRLRFALAAARTLLTERFHRSRD
jgi:hypothetical protein